LDGRQVAPENDPQLVTDNGGEACLHQCRQMQELVSEIELSGSPTESEPKGKIRITTPVAFAQSQLTRLIAVFLARYPKTELSYCR